MPANPTAGPPSRPAPTVALVPVTALVPAEWNPRLVTDARFADLRRSIRDDPEFLWHNHICAMADGTIYVGNMRYRAAVAEGWSHVPANIEDVDATTAKQRSIRDNVHAGEFSDDALAELLVGIQETDTQADLGALGISDGDLAALLVQVGYGEDQFLDESAGVADGRDPWPDDSHAKEQDDGVVVLTLTMSAADRRSLLAAVRVISDRQGITGTSPAVIAICRQYLDGVES